MEALRMLFILSCAIFGAQQSKLSKRDEKLLRFKKEIDNIAEDLETFAFDIAKEIVEKSELYIPDYDYEEDYPTEQNPAEPNAIAKEAPANTTASKPRTKRSPDPDHCYEKLQAEQHLEKLHIEDLKEEIRHLYELVTILRDQQRILSALDQEKEADLARRFDPQELLRMLEELNNSEGKSKPFSTHLELAKIKTDLRRAVAALDQTKAVLVRDRKKEMALEAELQLLENATKPGNDTLLGAAPHLPKHLPEARASSSSDLLRLLDKLEQPKAGEEKLRRLRELLDQEEPKPDASKVRLLVQLLERAQGREEAEAGVGDELRQLQAAIEKLRPKEEAEAFGLEGLFGGRGQVGGGGNGAKLTQQQLVELRKKLDLMIASGGAGSGQPATNFAAVNAPPPYPFWYPNYRNLGPYPNNQGPNAYGYDRGQYGPEPNSLYAGFDGSRYRPENNPYGRDFWMNRYRNTVDTSNRFFPGPYYLPEDSSAGDPGQAGPHLLPDYRTKDIEELKNQIVALQNVIDSMNYQSYGKRPEDEATVANLERQIKDLRGIVNGFNQEVAPSYSQQASSINQPPPNFNQSPPSHELPINDLPQQPYEAHQVTKRSAMPENEPSLIYNPPSVSNSHSPASFNKPPSSNNQSSPDQEPPEDSLLQNHNTHQMTKRSAMPEDTSSALNRFFKPNTYLFDDKRISENDLSYNQSPVGYNQVPLSYQKHFPSYSQSLTSRDEPPPSYNQVFQSYKQSPPSYRQSLTSYNEPLPSYNQPSLSYKQPDPSYSQPLTSYNEHLPSVNQPLTSYNEPPPSYSQPSLSFNKLPSSYNQPFLSYKQHPLSYNQLPLSFSQLLTSYNKPLSSYNQTPLSYRQPLTSFNQPPLSFSELLTSYNKPPSSYSQPPASHNQPPPGRSSADSRLLDEVYSKLKNYLLEDDHSSNQDALVETISSLKAQLDNQYSEHHVQQPLGMSSRTPYGYYHPGSEERSLQKSDILGNIVAKIIEKILEALPTVFEKLFGLTDVPNGVQDILKSFGTVGLVPVVLLKLLGGLDILIGVLRGNKFFRTFLLPALVVLVVSGSVVFLIWWLQGDAQYKQIGYVGPQDQGYGYPNGYSKSTGAPIFFQGYSRSYYDNNRKLDRF